MPLLNLYLWTTPDEDAGRQTCRIHPSAGEVRATRLRGGLVRMRRGVAALATALVLAGCQSETEPAPPPPSEDALTTTDAPAEDTAPATSPPPDDVEETSAEPTTEAPETTEDSGPPEFPVEAQEDSESGAEAFALHYIDMINYTSRYPEVGLLGALSSDGCASCRNREDSVAYSSEHGERMERDLFAVIESVPLHSPADSSAIVRVGVQQIAQDVFDEDDSVVDTIDDREATLVFELAWSGEWLVDEVTVDVGRQ